MDKVFSFKPLRLGNGSIYFKAVDSKILTGKEIEKAVNIYGKKYFYDGEEKIGIHLRHDDLLILEDELPTHIIIFRGYLTKLFNVVRSITPYINIIMDEDSNRNLTIVLQDKYKNPNVVRKFKVTTNNLTCKKEPNIVFENVYEFYKECVSKNIFSTV